jgi:SAM-dependent methyltransferase
VLKRREESIRLPGEGLECVNYCSLLFTSTLWRDGVKSRLKPFIVSESSRERDEITLKGFSLSSGESKAVEEYLTSLKPNDASITYLAVAPSRLIPQPPSHWDDLTEKHLPKGALSQRTQVLKQVADEACSIQKKSEGILDAACGDGRLLKLISRENPDTELWGFDSNKNSVRKAKEKLGKRASILYGDARNLPNFLPRINFGVVSAVGLLDAQVVSRENGLKILAGIHNTLSDGGILACANYTMPTLSEKDFGENGFTILKKTIPKNFFTAREPKELIIARKQH